MARSAAIRVVLVNLLAALLAFPDAAGAADPAPGTNRPAARSDIRVIVRSSVYVEALRKQAIDRQAPQPIVRPLAGDLWLICVIDLPRQVNMLTDRDLEKLGLSQDEAIALGKENVAADLPPGSTVISPLTPGAIGYIIGHFYEASRLLMHEDWAALSQEMNGQLVVALPVPEGILYIEGRDRAALEALTRVAEATAKDDQRRISTQLLRWVPDGWEVVAP